MTASEFNESFGLPGVLHFDEHGELTRARITLPSSEACIYLQGAQLTHWKPTGEQPVFFLSSKSSFAQGKAIRGGIPICFPWFGPRTDGGAGPQHGFARTQPWQLAFAALMPDAVQGDRLQLTFVLPPTPASEALGFSNFRVAYEVLLGRTLTVKLTVANTGEAPFRFEEALHAYFQVGDVQQTSLSGLESAPYLDKRDDAIRKLAPGTPLTLTSWTDRVFPANAAPLTLRDRANARTIHITKTSSDTTVIWNPWPEGSASLSDLAPDEWTHFLCAEAANTATDAITLAPGETHAMSLHISVETDA